MTHRAPQDDHRRGLRLAMPGPRTRFVVAAIGCLLSVGAPVMLLGAPGRTLDKQPAGPATDPAGLGITGALPRDLSPSDVLPNDVLPGGGVPDGSGEVGLSGLPIPMDLPDGPLGIPGVVLGAYQRAERTVAASRPGCRLSWSVLAGIGRIESGHASEGRVDAAGNTLGSILGLPLDGSPGVAAIADTDRGVLDADTVWDRAVGPMQFIPTSWRSYGVDGNGDGVASPHNIYDSTLAAGRYLCAGGGDLADPAQLRAAVFRYNHSATYVTIVLRWAQAYLSGVVPTVPTPGPVPPGTTGNGGASIVPHASPAAVPPAILALPAPPVPPPVVATPVPPPVMATPVPPPVMATPVPPPVMATPVPPPVMATPVPPVTATPLPPATTTSPATDSNPPSPPPTTTTTPVELALGSPPPPPLAKP